jgi:molecular chaperone DnaJ
VNLRVSKKGHAGNGAPPGDLIIHVKVKPHGYFRREGSDIHTELFLTISQAVLGAELSVKTLYGDVSMKVTPGTQHDERKKISNYGV